MRATIKDVAKMAKCSITTVSLVINGKGEHIPQTTKDKIFIAQRKLNYRPNQIAVSMVTKATKILGLIIPDNSNYFFAELSKALETEANKAGYNLIYGNSDNKIDMDIQYMNMFADRQVDGLILVRSTAGCEEKEEELLKLIEQTRLPIIAVDRSLPAEICHSVVIDNTKGGYIATRHLLDLGHTRIACYSGPTDLDSSQQRLKGYRMALEESGIPYDSRLLVTGNYQMSQDEEDLSRVMALGATAVFACNDLMAFGVYKQAKRLKLKIPRDISVVGYDNSYFCEMVTPELTSIEQPVMDMGRCAIEILLRMISDGEKNSLAPLIFTPTLVCRDSTKRNTER